MKKNYTVKRDANLDAIYFYLDRDGKVKDGTDEQAEAGTYVKKIKISRVRDKNTGIEGIVAEMYDELGGETPYAVERFGSGDLSSSIFRLREFGFLINRGKILEMAKTIEKRYFDMKISIVEGVGTLESDLNGILRHICRYIKDNDIKAKVVGTNEVYIIYVNDFNRLFKGSQFSRYRITNIRRALQDGSYTLCTTGRLDYTVKDSGSPVKIIAIRADAQEVMDIMQELEDGE